MDWVWVPSTQVNPLVMPDIHDRYAGVGGCYVVNAQGIRVPDGELVTDPEPEPTEDQVDHADS